MVIAILCDMMLVLIRVRNMHINNETNNNNRQCHIGDNINAHTILMVITITLHAY